MFVKGRKKDKCLKDFSQYIVTLEKVDGKEIWGRLRVENTGMELMYEAVCKDADGHLEGSYILYKNEYGNIATLLRYHSKLSDAGKKRRQKQLDRTYHPGFFRRLKRKIANLFRTVRDLRFFF
jgi:small nuclear ribonucleoprotein (snRNP)-like protein